MKSVTRHQPSEFRNNGKDFKESVWHKKYVPRIRVMTRILTRTLKLDELREINSNRRFMQRESGELCYAKKNFDWKKLESLNIARL